MFPCLRYTQLRTIVVYVFPKGRFEKIGSLERRNGAPIPSRYTEKISGKADAYSMKTRINLVLMLALALTLIGATLTMAQQAAGGTACRSAQAERPCDIYAAAGDPCVAAHSTTRALYASYNGPLYQVLRQSDGKTLDIGVVQPVASPVPDAGGYANAAAQDAFCANTYCWITTIYDQSPKHNDLTQAPRGGFSGPAMGGFNNLPVADMAPITIMGHKAYGVFIEPGMGLRA